MTNRETSDTVSSIAAKYLHFGQTDLASLDEAGQAQLVTAIRALAGSALSQDQTPGKRVAGKHPALADPYGRDKAGRDLGLREITDNMRAKIVDYSDSREKVDEPTGFLLEAFEQYADQIDEYRPAAGTSAYELIAAVETQNVETTETLIHMVAATVLMKRVLEVQGPIVVATEVTFSPADMDRMHQHYILSATNDGMNTTVRIEPRAGALPSLSTEPGIDDTPAEPQAEEHIYDRPLWAARIGGKVFPASDREQAERMARGASDGETAQVENRFCYHEDCPASHCYQVPAGTHTSEVTSC